MMTDPRRRTFLDHHRKEDGHRCASHASTPQRLLYSRIAADDDRDSLATEEEAVACRAGRHPASSARLFGRNPKPFRLSARRIDQCIAEIVVPAVSDKTKRTFLRFDRNDVVVQNARSHVLSLSPHLLDQPGTLDDLGEPRVVLDVCRRHELPAGLYAGQQYRPPTGTRGVDRRRVTRRARTHDDDGCPMFIHDLVLVSLRLLHPQTAVAWTQKRLRVLNSINIMPSCRDPAPGLQRGKSSKVRFKG